MGTKKDVAYFHFHVFTASVWNALAKLELELGAIHMTYQSKLEPTWIYLTGYGTLNPSL